MKPAAPSPEAGAAVARVPAPTAADDETGHRRYTPNADDDEGKLTIGATTGNATDNESLDPDVEKVPVEAVEARHPLNEADVAPDGGYGWVCVGCVFMINAHTWGLNSSYGIFLSHYLSHDTFAGSTPLEYAFVGGLSIAMSNAISPVATYLIRRFGVYAPLYLGIFLQTVALLGASWSVQIWQLFLSQGVCFGIGMGLIFNATVGIIPQWFDRRRSFANSIGTAGSGIGGLIYSLATQAMIRSLGLGWSFRILAIVSCAVCLLSALLLKDRNTAIGSIYNAFDLRLLRLPQYLLTLAWAFFSIIGYVCLLFSLPNYAVSIGLSPAQASLVGALLNLGQAIGRPLIGYFSDSLGRLNTCLSCTLACGILCFALWIPATSYGVLIAFSLLGGAVAGTLWTTVAPVMAEVVGLQRLPSALSLVWVSLVLPSTFAEVIALELRLPRRPVYRNAQVFVGVMYVAAAVSLWFVRAWKVAEVSGRGKGDVGKSEEEGVRDEDEDAVERTESQMLGIRRTRSVAQSVKTVAEASRGLWAWTKV